MACFCLEVWEEKAGQVTLQHHEVGCEKIALAALWWLGSWGPKITPGLCQWARPCTAARVTSEQRQNKTLVLWEKQEKMSELTPPPKQYDYQMCTPRATWGSKREIRNSTGQKWLRKSLNWLWLSLRPQKDSTAKWHTYFRLTNKSSPLPPEEKEHRSNEMN
jgi:hypothetical protein